MELFRQEIDIKLVGRDFPPVPEKIKLHRDLVREGTQH